MKLRYLLLAAVALAQPAYAQNAPSGSPRTQGVPDGYGDPVQVTIVGADGSDTTLGVTSVATGNVAHDATDAGNPVKVGCFASSGGPTAVVSTDRANVWCGLNGNLAVTYGPRAAAADANANSTHTAVVATDGVAAFLGVYPYVFNGTTWDRPRGNIDTAALINAAGATTSQTGADQTNYNGRGLQVVLDMTVVGTGSVTLTIQGKDAASGKYYTLLAGAAVVTNSTNLYTVYPGAPTTANASASLPLPRVWRVITTANNANATTYTVGASVIQ